MAKEENTRIVLDIGYHHVLLPEGTKVDPLRFLLDGVRVETKHVTGHGTMYLPTGEKSLGLNIIKNDQIAKIQDGRGDNHPEYDIIIDQVKEKLEKSKHKGIVFSDGAIEVGGSTIKYLDLADPATDPEEVINEIVEKALDTG